MGMQQDARRFIGEMKPLGREEKITFFAQKVAEAKMELTETENGIFRDGYILALLASNLGTTGPLSALISDIASDARSGAIFSGRNTWHNIALAARQQLLVEQFMAKMTNLDEGGT